MAGYTPREYSEMIKLYCQNGCVAAIAARAYAEANPNAPAKPTGKTIQRAWMRLVETGSVMPNKKECGVRATVFSADCEDAVLDRFQRDGTRSIRDVARELRVSKSSVHRVLKREKMHAFHYSRVQELEDGDRARRVEFCQWLLGEEARAPGFVKNILFTDEATFQRNGFFNQRNDHYWSVENPFLVNDQKSVQRRFKKNIWAGMIGDKVVSKQKQII